MDRRAAGARAEAQHDRGGEGPGLRGVVAYLVDRDADLLADLAAHRILQAFARLDEAGQHRMHPGWPDRLAAEHDPVTVMDQHDDRGVGAGEMLGAAGRRGAASQMPALGALRRAAANAAEAVAAVPVQQAAG